MAWRIVYVSEVNRLSLNLNSLKIVKGDDEYKIPLNDIFALVIEDLTVTVTTRLLIELSDYNILVIFCNQKHLPECLLQPISGHYRQYSQTRQQLDWERTEKEVLWKLIVKQKN
ncbi:CRISPR-associated endonuclease Cas1 [Staphylococcus pseudintermedius]|uniref:CRISPR-associated endonuclease Cas1 n=1 Tax=Staphylococcus pseudintermedius TaxID=283734 RepID=UPI0021574DC8|nr:CRISPR-associated endonuclease Cas1 [Staphylococcus pseudintermedius]WMZ54568.1 CRISPR-associated endonuclease Cas1 [Staphylococcus pseudintermedius]